MENTIIASIVSVVTVLGGWEGIKYLLNRNANKRIEAAHADVEEVKADKEQFEFLTIQIEYLQKQLTKKDEQLEKKDEQIAKKDEQIAKLGDQIDGMNKRFEEQTLLVRSQNTQILTLTQEKAGLLAERSLKLCEVKKCKDRQPQSNW